MNTNDLITEVRHGLIEYQTAVVSNSLIISMLNQAYRKLYNHYTRADDNMFGEIHELSITQGTRIYDLPRNLWSKRIDYLQVPLPNDNAKAYDYVPKIDAKQSHKYNLPQAFSIVPYAWQQLGSQIEIFPKPQIDFTARLIIQPRLIPLAETQGTTLSFATPVITCVEDLSNTFADYASLTNGNNYLSVCDGVTGDLKGVYAFTSVTSNLITLSAPGLRASVKGEDLSSPSADSDIILDDVVTYGLSTGVPITGEAFDEFLVKYAVLTIKSSLNENDQSYAKQIEELKGEYLSDSVGRPSTTVIERVRRGGYYLGRHRSSR